MSFLLFLLEFFKIGAFTYGGGLAMIPILRETSLRFNWLTEAQFADLIAVSQSTPGPIAINMATYIGYREFSILGAILASLILILPAFLMALMLGNFLARYKDERFVKAGFVGIKATIIGLVGAAIVQVGKVSLLTTGANVAFDIKAVLLMLFFFWLILKTQKHPVLYVFLAAIIGIVVWN